MAHNINIRNGKASFASAKQPAWHGLGQILDGCMTSEEAIKHSGLDFEVGKAPLITRIPLVKDIIGLEETSYVDQEVKGKFATYRKDDNTVFGVVGSKYEVVQNKDAFRFFDAIVGEGEAIYETAGALGKGEIIFITAKLPSYIHVKGDDVVEKYLLLTMTHDGSGAIHAMFTPTRVVCWNTLQAAYKDGIYKVSVRHTKSAEENLKQAHKIMGITNSLSNELDGIFNQMANVQVPDKKVEGFIQMLFPGTKGEDGEYSSKILNIRDNVLDYMIKDETQRLKSCMIDNTLTAWGCYNGVVGYLQHCKNFKDESSKMKSLLLGSDYEINRKALVLAKELCEIN